MSSYINTRPNEKCEICNYLLFKSLISQVCPSGSIGQSGPVSPVGPGGPVCTSNSYVFPFYFPLESPACMLHILTLLVVCNKTPG